MTLEVVLIDTLLSIKALRVGTPIPL